MILGKRRRQRVQRLMRVAPWPEPVGEAQEVRLVDGVEYLDDGPLDDLVLQRDRNGTRRYLAALTTFRALTWGNAAR